MRPRQQVAHLFVLCLAEVLVPLADGAEQRGCGEAHDLIGEGGNPRARLG
jgi:hypothetical protein